MHVNKIFCHYLMVSLYQYDNFVLIKLTIVPINQLSGKCQRTILF